MRGNRTCLVALGTSRDVSSGRRTVRAVALIAMIIASGCGLPDDSELQSDGEIRGGRPGKFRPDAALPPPTPDASVTQPTDAALPLPLPPVDAAPFEPGPAPTPTPSVTIGVTLVPEGATGVQRINFAVPFAAGAITSADNLRIVAGGTARSAARRVLSRHPDGSARAIQLQLDIDVSATTQLTVEVGVPGTSGPALAAVSTTLTGSGNSIRPRVWALLPTSTLLASGIAGPLAAPSTVAGSTLDTWTTKCNYTTWNTDAFVPLATSRDVWLYDRVTAMYRGYLASGSQSPLRSAYREAGIYLGGMTITNGVTTAIAVPTASSDLKYHYAQGMALHYLLTGDDRYREAAEAVSARVANLWSPTSTSFWTERHAGFALLAHEWAARVTDDLATTINARANTAATAFLSLQNAAVSGYTDANARCFAHSADAHAEPYGYTGCSPWMSALLAEALDAHGTRVGGTRATEVKTSLAKLGRIIARDGRDSIGRPVYWMGVGTSQDDVDPYDEHWGEAAYVLALAWNATGRSEAGLKTAADAFAAGFRSRGTVPHMRSFNWQCRAAVMTPALLK